ncbi:MAG: type II toxin-antitoxin system VapC family toxin [Methylobacter sp.]
MGTRYLLDTNICILIVKHNPPAVRERFALHAAFELVMSVIKLGELRFCAEKSQSRERALASINQLEAVNQVVSLPVAAGEHCGQIRATLQSKERIISNYDLWLAAHARAEGWILVTNNEREFVRVEGLQVENWAESERL